MRLLLEVLRKTRWSLELLLLLRGLVGESDLLRLLLSGVSVVIERPLVLVEIGLNWSPLRRPQLRCLLVLRNRKSLRWLVEQLRRLVELLMSQLLLLLELLLLVLHRNWNWSLLVMLWWWIRMERL